MKKTNGQSGITLIALVVTIVVLLILAGITITFVLSDGGIFSTAQKAGTQTNVGQVRDYATNAVAAIVAHYYDSTVTGTKNYSNILTASFPSDATFNPAPNVSVAETVVDTETNAKTLSVTMAETTVSWKGNDYKLSISGSGVAVEYVGKTPTEP